jgi:hypothetical protein
VDRRPAFDPAKPVEDDYPVALPVFVRRADPLINEVNEVHLAADRLRRVIV